MSDITNCPACQTQFVVSKEQLNQYSGKVRCGSCLNVFDATQHMVGSKALSSEPSITNDNAQRTGPATKLGEESEQRLHAMETHERGLDDAPQKTNRTFDYDITDTLSVDDTSKAASSNWLLMLFCAILLLAAVIQSLFFLRTTIATYYPESKPYLLKICETLKCNIDLPKKIELIAIDDSDMQEDADALGLVHLSSTLINQAGFSQDYPNLELTLTDLEDLPKLRRIFKPNEYLPANTDVTKGLAAGEEIKIKLALTTPGEKVAGYRLAVAY
jgi:predicted Zn finger-like uncharacterized protein